MSGGYIYILGSHTGTLYIGVTSDLYLRVMQYKEGTLEGFTATYGCNRLLYFEGYEDIRTAIAREKQLKGWRREKKLNLIRTINPEDAYLAVPFGAFQPPKPAYGILLQRDCMQIRDSHADSLALGMLSCSIRLFPQPL